MYKYVKASTDWFSTSLGLSVHWTTRTQPLHGKAKVFADAVAAFDLNHFVDQVKESGAEHLIFTTTHGEQYLAGPNPVLDFLLPGRTSSRDLLGELAECLNKNGIRTIFYYNHSCNGSGDPAWMAASGYTGAPLELFSGHIMNIVEYMSRRYGKLISGWWFDSSYSVDPRGPHNSVTTEMGDWRFPWESLTAAAKAGNSDSIVTYNSGIDLNYLYTGHQDYWAGETTSLEHQPCGRWNNGLQLHQWTCTDNQDWVHRKSETPFSAMLYSDAELIDFASRITNAQGAVTFNVEIAQDGTMNPTAIAQLRTVGQHIKEERRHVQ